MVVSSALSSPLICAHLANLTHQTYSACNKESYRNCVVYLSQHINTSSQQSKGLKQLGELKEAGNKCSEVQRYRSLGIYSNLDNSVYLSLYSVAKKPSLLSKYTLLQKYEIIYYFFACKRRQKHFYLPHTIPPQYFQFTPNIWTLSTFLHAKFMKC